MGIDALCELSGRLRALFRSSQTSSSTSELSELDQRIDTLERRVDDRRESLERARTHYNDLLASATEIENGTSQELREGVATALLWYMDEWRRLQRLQNAIHHCREADAILATESKDPAVVEAFTDRVLTGVEQHVEKRTGVPSDRDDLPHRWRSSYHFPDRTDRWTANERATAVDRATEILAADDTAADHPPLVDVVEHISDEKTHPIEPGLVDGPGTGDLGNCPECDAVIFAPDRLLKEEREAGKRSWADCPGCGSVVVPSSGTGIDLLFL